MAKTHQKNICRHPNFSKGLAAVGGPQTAAEVCQPGNLVPDSTKQAALLELTVPWEDHLEEAFERKLSKYAGLESNCQQAGWRARCLPVEAGGRRFAACSLAKAYSNLGIEG